MLRWLTMSMVALALLAPATQAARNIVGPLDTVVGVPNDGDWPPNEVPRFAVDHQVTTKYLHFKGHTQPTGIRVTPIIGPTIVTGMTFTTANDAVERDPVRWELYGSNDSIDGPYTLIASGDIVDFAGSTAWPRRTKTTTPIRFTNTVEYLHYQVMFPLVRDPAAANSMQIAEIELLMDVFIATNPNPPDGGMIGELPLFQWIKGDTAVRHDVYFGATPDLTEADRRVTRGLASNLPSQMYFHQFPPLEPGVTYYWRVDQIDRDGQVYIGDVWSAMAPPQKAYHPTPRDGDKWLPLTTTLNWMPGVGADERYLYFGTDRDAVAARDDSVAMGKTISTFFEPELLVEQTTYYWAVDEIINGMTYAGDVWEFTTLGEGGGLRGDYFFGTTLDGEPAFSRIDENVNFNWGAEGPGESLPSTGWGARWTADLEVAVTDTFTFAVTAEGGARLWIDGELVIDQWVSWVPTTYASLPMRLERGIHSLQLEFACWDRNAQLSLQWETPTSARAVIPAGPLQPPLRARAVYPPSGAIDVPQDAMLVWGAGEKAAGHNVYFGTDRDAVASATPETAGIYRGRQTLANTSFDPGALDWDQAYFWRIDEVNDAEPDSPWKSSVWSFTTADFLVIDDMESYTDDEGNRIYQAWLDGWGVDENGSQVGYDESPFAELRIVHGGRQSMPLAYDNTTAAYSEALREFTSAQDWTVNGVTDLTLYVRGYPAVEPINVVEAAGKISLTGAGRDIWGTSDEFSFVHKTLRGDGAMVARVVSNGTGTHNWAKGGVMIRESLNGDSAHAMMVMTGGGGNGASFQWRPATGNATLNTDSAIPVAPPYWVKVERQGSMLTGSISANGTTWTILGTAIIEMADTVYVGLCVTSQTPPIGRTYEFDSISGTPAVSGQWKGVIISSPRHNDPQDFYLVVEDSTGNSAKVTDPDVVTTGAWTELKFPLDTFTGVNTTRVKKLRLGVGDRTNPVPGQGLIYVDDIRVTR